MRRYWFTLLGLVAAIGLAIPDAAQASSVTEHLARAEAAGYERAFDHSLGDAKLVKTTVSKATAGANSACRVGLWNGSVYGPPWGYGICGTQESTFQFPGTSTYQSFVIGLDHAIWTTWTGQTTWQSMGGQACGSSGCGVYSVDNSPTVGVFGPQGTAEWCDTRFLNGTWSGWSGCSF